MKPFLDVLFSDKYEVSFWDAEKSRIRSKLVREDGSRWKASNDRSDRYGLFTLFCILLSKEVFGLDTIDYDKKICSYLKYIKRKIFQSSMHDITYGAFNSLVLAHSLYEDIDFDEEICFCLDHFQKKLTKIEDNEHSLLFVGLYFYLKRVKSEERILAYFRTLLTNFLRSQDRKGIFQTGDLRAPYHQRLMYPIWALALVGKEFWRDEIRAAIEKTIDFVWEYRRQGDNAFLWHAPVYFVKTKMILPILVPSFRSAKYLFSCHQTFFVTAINLYNLAFSSCRYQEEKDLAFHWITGQNRINRSMIGASGIGIPLRIMKTDGTLNVKNQNFVGSYELGSHILAMAGNEYFQNKACE